MSVAEFNTNRCRTSLPPDVVISCFDNAVVPMFERQKHNNEESRTLTQTRDLLLPKLMSGEIRVKDAEKIASEAI